MALAACILLGLSATAQQVRGDVTGDGTVDIADVNEVINIMLGKGGPIVTTYTVNGVSFTMVSVQGGSFTMGATTEQGSEAYGTEKPVHQVTLSSFSIGQTEVTQELWLAVMGSNPSYFQASSDPDYGTNLQRPVEQVSWNACQEFITKLNELTGKTFRLPTEAEWEYAARGGNKSQGYKYAGSYVLDKVGWYWGNIPSQMEGTQGYGTQTVATKSPNELGIYDMSGNVWEWCHDWYSDDYYSESPSLNPQGAESGNARSLRGGSWHKPAKECRVSCRGDWRPTEGNNTCGFRLAL